MAKQKTPNGDVAIINEDLLKGKIYPVRGVKVILDCDLAEIYGYSVKAFNQQVKNNIEKFDADFRFQLNREEYREILGSKILTLEQGKYSKTNPYAFTEQGVYMLMTVLRGELATRQSKALIRLFKEMKEYIVAENQQLLGSAGLVQLAVQTERNTHEIKEIRQNLQTVMDNFVDPNTYRHYLIMNGEKFEADVAYAELYALAKKSIFVIDEYVSVKTLDLLRGVSHGLRIVIFSDQWGRQVLTETILKDFRTARPDLMLEIKPAMNLFHDRYVFIDYNEESEVLYHCGMSSKDAGNKIGTVMLLEFREHYHKLVDRLLKAQ